MLTNKCDSQKQQKTQQTANQAKLPQQSVTETEILSDKYLVNYLAITCC